MDTTNQDRSGWETQEQVDACLADNDVSPEQNTRWRRDGLLSDVEQVPSAYYGSAVFYPAGTCAQIAAAARLFREKNRINYVGRMLWWEGFPVDERYWKPDLISLAGWADRVCGWIAPLMDREGDNQRTLPERLSDAGHSDIILSRVRPRLEGNELASVLRVALDTASGCFTRFEEPERDSKGRERSFDETAIVRGLDLAASGTHSIFGHRLRLKEEIEGALKAAARAIRTTSFSDVATGREEIIFAARNDVRNALRMELALYEACEWVYGRQAFGLRLVAWIAKKRPTTMIGIMILGFAQLRRASNQLLSSEEIAALADTAEAAQRDSQQLQSLWKSDKRFRHIFAPKRIRAAFRDRPSYDRWIREVGLAASYTAPEG
ncbi:MAG: hypothetical protein ABSD21_05355 [Rhizomicrobium sp.]|jgi:hypothetical protein